MKTGTKGISLIKSFESIHDGDLTAIGLQPKMDPVGIYTEGYGRAMRDPATGNFLRGKENKERAYKLATITTEDGAVCALLEDLKVYERIVSSKVKVSLTQNQFDALVSHTYNTGGSNTLFDLVNARAEKSKIFTWFTEKYISAGGVKLNGLVRRRKSEADLFFTT